MNIGPGHLLYDTEGRLVARVVKNLDGTWMIIPEPDYPLVIDVDSGIVKLWDRTNNKPVKMVEELRQEKQP